MRKGLSLLGLTVGILVGGCSSATADSDANEADVVGQYGDNKPAAAGDNAVCTFPVRKHEREIPAHYITWTSDGDREKYLDGFLPSMGLKRSADAASVPAIQKIVDELYPSIRAVLPAETTGMEAPPRVVLLADPLPNAFAAGDGRENPIRAPWLLFVNEGLLALKPPAEELKGVMAHELAHLMAKHQFPDAPERVRRHYSVGERPETSITPSLEKDDASVKAFAAEFERLGGFGGVFDVPALDGFSVKFSGLRGPIRYHTFFELLGRGGTPECATHAETYAAFQESLRSKLSKFDHELHIDATDAAALAPKVAEAKAAAKACATTANATLTELATVLELSLHPQRQEELQALAAQGGDALSKAVLDADELAVESKSDDLVTKLLTIGKKKRALLAAHVAKAPVKMESMRRYAEEVEADQIAVRVLAHGKIDPTGGAKFLLRTLDDTTRAQCESTLGANKIPPFGGFSFLHPATCWRVFQAKLFATTLGERCK